MLVMLSFMPVWDAINLLTSLNYTMFMGRSLPLMVIARAVLSEIETNRLSVTMERLRLSIASCRQSLDMMLSGWEVTGKKWRVETEPEMMAM